VYLGGGAITGKSIATEGGVMKRVLLVDDEEEVLNLWKEFTEKLGYEAFLARNGIEAAEVLGAEQIDVVVTDVVMPGLDGLALATWIKEAYPDVRVIGTSGRVRPWIGHVAPFDVFLPKPVGFARFKEVLADEGA